MENICLFEDGGEANLQPLISTKPIFLLRTGAFTLLDRFKALFPSSEFSSLTRNNLNDLAEELGLAVHSSSSNSGRTLYFNARISSFGGDIVNIINDLYGRDESAFTLFQDDILLAASSEDASFDPLLTKPDSNSHEIENVGLISGFGDLISGHSKQIGADFPLFSSTRAHLNPNDFPKSHFKSEEQIIVSENLEIEPNCYLDASTGPILLEKGVTIKAGSVIYGPSFIGEGTIVNPMTKLKEVILGPRCKIGGEVSKSTFEGYSNKSHNGYVGNSYISRWCNLGADTNTSNLRNDYGPVKLFNEREGREIDTGLNFAGLIMADHSKCSINTMFNTGTVIGVSCNLFGAGFHDRHIKSLTWGKPGKYLPFRIDKAIAVAERMMARRGQELGAAERFLLESLSN